MLDGLNVPGIVRHWQHRGILFVRLGVFLHNHAVRRLPSHYWQKRLQTSSSPQHQLKIFIGLAAPDNLSLACEVPCENVDGPPDELLSNCSDLGHVRSSTIPSLTSSSPSFGSTSTR